MNSLPNIISISRIVVTPVFLLLFFNTTLTNWIVIATFFYVILSDFLDGFFARKHKTQSVVGKLLDPLADKCAVLTILSIFVAEQQFSVIPFLIFLLRDLIVETIRALAIHRNLIIAASWYGKSKTVFQFLLAGLLIYNHAFTLPFANSVIFTTTIIAVVFTLVSFIDYFVKYYNTSKANIK